MEPQENKSGPEIMFLQFADSKIPLFKEARNKDYIQYGADNLYPEYLTYLYNKSPKHNSIINNKVLYIFGEGYENGDFIINRLDESLNDISDKALKDVEVYGGFKLEITYNALGKIAEIYHVDYSTIRKAKTGGFYYKESWDSHNRDEPEHIPAFNPHNPTGSQIYEYNEYRPMTRFYPLPSYIGCNNYVEVDIEIGKFNLSFIRNGMMPSKMIQFYTGDPGSEGKREIERRFTNKFSGAENAGRFIFVFNQLKEKSVDISDLSGSDMDKMFTELNKTCQQEILSGHNVTSPALFGIKTEGQLGATSELYVAYSIFQNTYAKPKAQAFDKEINYLLSFSVFPGVYELAPTDPIGIQFDVKDVINSLPKAFVFDKLNIPKDLWDTENIGADNRPTPTVPIAPLPEAAPNLAAGSGRDLSMTSAILQNLSGRQRQGIYSILNQYDKGKTTRERAIVFLRGGYGFSDDEINQLLGVKAAQMSAQDEDDYIVGMFDACGDNKSDFQIIKSKNVSFENDSQAERDEEIFKSSFKDALTVSEEKIIELIRKDKLITSDVIANVIGQSKAYVESKIENLVQRGYVEQSTMTQGEDILVERIVSPEVDIPVPPTLDKMPITEISIKYSYEPKPGLQPIIATTRQFCRKMIGLNRIYSRAEIENISQRLGYSVFDRKGGWWGSNPECRHRWVSHIVVKKKGGFK